MQKNAKFVDSGLTDPKWGKPIRVSSAAWSFYMATLNLEGTEEDNPGLRKFRNSIRGYAQGMSLRQIIAKDFEKSAGRIVHYFRLGNPPPDGSSKEEVKSWNAQREWAEIRNVIMSGKGSSYYFVSAIRDGSIDILCIQSKMYPVKYFRNVGPDEDGVSVTTKKG